MDQLVWLSHDLIDRGGVVPPTAEIWSLSGHSCGHRAVKGAQQACHQVSMGDLKTYLLLTTDYWGYVLYSVHCTEGQQSCGGGTASLQPGLDGRPERVLT